MTKIKKLRLEKEWSQIELSKRSGVSQSHIHYLESGSKNPTVSVLEKIAKAFGVKVSDLLNNEESPAS